MAEEADGVAPLHEVDDGQTPTAEEQAAGDAKILEACKGKFEEAGLSYEPEPGDGGDGRAKRTPTPATGERKPRGEGGPRQPEGKPEGLDPATLARAELAGINPSQVERLHQAGLLEEILAAADRRAIAAFERPQGGTAAGAPAAGQATAAQPAGGQPPAPTGENQRGDQAPPRQAEMPPPLADAEEEYPPEIVARDKWHQEQIAALRAELEGMQTVANRFARQQQTRFDSWLDKRFEELDSEFYGKGRIEDLPPDSPEVIRRRKVATGYIQLCGAFQLDPADCDDSYLQRAETVTFPDQAAKAHERQMQRRLRDSEGRFVSPRRPSSGRPPARKTPPVDDGGEDFPAEALQKIEDIVRR